MTTSWSRLLEFEPHPDVWLLFLGLIGTYLLVVTRNRPDGHQRDPGRATWFIGGMLILWIGADWPIDDLGERSLLSVHMVQYLLLAMVAPGLILRGLPAWLVERLLEPTWLRRVARAVVRPWVAWIVVNTILLLTHWNPVIALYLRNDLFHLVMHVTWVASGLILWWPVLSPLDDAPRLSPPAQMGYLFIQSVLPTIPASFLTFADTPVFPAYGQLPKPPGIDAITDQQLAGLLMKLGGGIILWIVITIIFFRWAHHDTDAAPSTTPRNLAPSEHASSRYHR